MKNYTFHCIGRKSGAIGATHKFTATRKSENRDAAQLALYDEWEHIFVLTVDESDDAREALVKAKA